MPERETVISWNDPQRLEIDVRSKPVVMPLGGKPQELTWLGGQIFFADRAEWFEHMHKRLKALARAALSRHDPTSVMGTLAMGWDTALLEAALDRGLPIRVALPFQGVHSRRDLHHKQRFGRILERASDVQVVHAGGYEPWAYPSAIRACIDASDLVLAMWDGKDEHVAKDLDHATQAEKRTVNLWGSWRKYGGLFDAHAG